ncbi:hypothetical protein AVEN_144580-1 [Araneus ventricosus]|uniref:Uncharacterized protein n=1 Tax=Araneus ventricosus TaxID=182803 RepID=A0A4Y2BY09_ARAVE|nr:hypothetical protein AVEN_144580-1 [Araneus ventricosus]
MHAIQSTRPLSTSTRTWAGKGGVCEKSTNQRQRSQGNRLSVLGTSDPELANQGHAMSKHSRARSHHSLHITDPHWATPLPDPTGPIINTALPGSRNTSSPTPLGHRKVLQPGSGCQIFNTINSQSPPNQRNKHCASTASY